MTERTLDIKTWYTAGGVKVRQIKTIKHKRGRPLEVYHIHRKEWFTIKELIALLNVPKTTLYSWVYGTKPVLEFFERCTDLYDITDIANDVEAYEGCTKEQIKLLKKWENDYAEEDKL